MADLVSSASVAILSAALLAGCTYPQLNRSTFPEPEDRNALVLGAQQSEWPAIAAGIEKYEAQWRSLPLETEVRLKRLAESLTIEGMKKGASLVEYIPGGTIITTMIFTPAELRQGLGSQIDEKIQQKVYQDLADLSALRTEGYLRESKAVLAVLDNNDLRVQVVSLPGDKALAVGGFDKLNGNPSTSVGRIELWAESLTLLNVGELSGSSQNMALAKDLLEQLREAHLTQGDYFSARVAQALICRNTQGAEPHRRFVEMGGLSPEELTKIPAPISARVAHANYLARNLPSASKLEVMRVLTADVEVPIGIADLINLEERSGVIGAESASVARVEAKNAIYYAQQELKKHADPTIQDGLQIVRAYFEEAFPNDYRFRDPIQGVGTGIALRRTDCSTRALLSLAMLRAMGFDAGAEIIMAQHNGLDVPNEAAHMYNYVADKDGVKIFADFCSNKGATFVFPNNELISAKYVGSSGYTARVVLQSTSLPKIYGILVREPVQKMMIEFAAALLESKNETVTDFVQENPEWKSKADLLQKYAGFQDEIFGTKELHLWAEGSREAIRKLSVLTYQ